MRQEGNNTILEDEDLLLKWFDFWATQKSHLVVYVDGDFAYTACQKSLPAKDMEEEPERSHCLRCERSKIAKRRLNGD